MSPSTPPGEGLFAFPPPFLRRLASSSAPPSPPVRLRFEDPPPESEEGPGDVPLEEEEEEEVRWSEGEVARFARSAEPLPGLGVPAREEGEP